MVGGLLLLIKGGRGTGGVPRSIITVEGWTIVMVWFFYGTANQLLNGW